MLAEDGKFLEEEEIECMVLQNCDHLTRNPNNDTVILHLNIRSIRKNWDIFKTHIKDVKVDVILLSEVAITESEAAIYTLAGYDSRRVLREERRGGGLIIFWQDTANFVQTQCALHACESITGEYTNNKGLNMNIWFIYRPPDNDIQTFLNSLEHEISHHKKKSNAYRRH